MSNHTPGPWRAEDAHDGYEIVSSSKGMSATVAVLAARRSVTGMHDARLIAAAPALLSALKTVCDFWKDSYPLPGSQPWLEEARAAIAEATGEP